jgi:hypothetical protein
LAYQWRKGGNNLTDGGRISGTTTAILSLSGVQAADAGSYDVVVSNTAGTATSQVARLTVRVNTAPVMGAVANQTVDELKLLTVQLSATDADVPANNLTFGLVSGPSGLTVDGAGKVQWTPTEAQGPSTNTVKVKVTDDGVPSLSATNSFTVVVKEVNTTPVLAPVSDRTVDELKLLTVQLSATDADVPANNLTFGLVSGPSGLTVAGTGQVQWTPAEAQGPSTNTVTVKVTDDGLPPLSATNSFSVVVRAQPRLELKAIGLVDGVFTMIANGVAGRTFTLQVSADLNSWTDFVTTNSVGATLTLEDRAARLASRKFYRLKQVQ